MYQIISFSHSFLPQNDVNPLPSYRAQYTCNVPYKKKKTMEKMLVGSCYIAWRCMINAFFLQSICQTDLPFSGIYFRYIYLRHYHAFVELSFVGIIYRFSFSSNCFGSVISQSFRRRMFTLSHKDIVSKTGCHSEAVLHSDYFIIDLVTIATDNTILAALRLLLSNIWALVRSSIESTMLSWLSEGIYP